MLYLWLKVIHVISSTLLFGTGLGSAYFMYSAHLTKDVPAIRYAARAVVIADWAFTTPAVVVQPVTGIWMAYIAGFSLWSPWLFGSMVLYVLIGACWIPVVWLQIKVQELASDAYHNGEPLPPKYDRYMRYWFWLGWPAFIGVIIIFYLMVFKPMSL